MELIKERKRKFEKMENVTIDYLSWDQGLLKATIDFMNKVMENLDQEEELKLTLDLDEG